MVKLRFLSHSRIKLQSLQETMETGQDDVTTPPCRNSLFRKHEGHCSFPVAENQPIMSAIRDFSLEDDASSAGCRPDPSHPTEQDSFERYTPQSWTPARDSEALSLILEQTKKATDPGRPVGREHGRFFSRLASLLPSHEP
eukprot:s4792_g3.t1